MEETLFEIFKFNNKEYILINKYKINNQIIYFFLNDEDELFCTKQKEEYIPILDKEKTKYIEKELGFIDNSILFDLFTEFLDGKNIASIWKKIIDKYTKNEKDEWIEISEEEKNKIIKESTKVLEKLKDKGINPKDFYERVKDVKIKTSADEYASNYGVRGTFFPKKNTIFYVKNALETDNMRNKRTRLHELLHKSTGKLLLEERKFFRGIYEGMTENTIDKVYGREKSSVIESKKNKTLVLLNFDSLTCYKTEVAIIKQMEYLLGKDYTSDVIYGESNMLKDFSNKYGKILTTYIKGKTYINNLENKIDEMIIGFEEAQNVILQLAFNKEFKNIESIEDAKEYMQKLQGFEKLRGSVYKERKGNFVEDNTFKEYYNKMHKKVKMIFKGYPKEQLDKLDEYTYKKQEKYPTDTKEDLHNNLKERLLQELAQSLAEGEEINLEELRVEETLDQDIMCTRVYKKNGKIIEGLIIESDDSFTREDLEERKDKLITKTATREYYFDEEDINTIMKHKSEIEQEKKEREELKQLIRLQSKLKMQITVNRIKSLFANIIKSKDTQNEEER